MKFSELLSQEHNSAGIIDAAGLTQRLPDTPLDVIAQLYADHGRKHDFQSQYGALDIAALKWTNVARTAEELLECCNFAEFTHWMNSVAQRAVDFHGKGWSCVDSRKDVVKHWQTHQTWLRPPIFLAGEVMGNAVSLRLVEGHTRIGLLRGLVKAGVIEPSSRHEIWLGQ